MPKKKTTLKTKLTKRLPSLQRRQSVDPRQPQEQQHCPARPPKAQEAAQAGPAPFSCEQVAAVGAQSRVPAPHSPSPTLGQQAEAGLAAPETMEGALAKEEGEKEPCRLRELCHKKDSSKQKLSVGELSGHPELWQGEDSSDRGSPRVGWYRIAIRTVWVNPRYPELLRSPPALSQDALEAAGPSDSGEQVPAAGSESQVSALHSSYCTFSCSSSCSSSLLSVQTLSEQQEDVHELRPSRSRQTLQSLRRTFWRSCVAAQPED